MIACNMARCNSTVPPPRPLIRLREQALRGEVLPIGGLKEKLLAAHRAGIKTVLIPQENEKDLVEIPKNILNKLDVKPVRWIDEVLELALTEMPTPLKDDDGSTESKTTAKAGRASKSKKSEGALRH